MNLTMSVQVQKDFEDLYSELDELQGNHNILLSRFEELKDAYLAAIQDDIQKWENKIKYIDEPGQNWEKEERLDYYERQLKACKIRQDFIIKK